jgi:anti-sigma-K factor RskA
MSERMGPEDHDDGAGAPPLAAEFVLGLVHGEERETLKRRAADDHAFAAEVGFWESRLGALGDEIQPQTPPAHVWTRIQQELGTVPVGAPRTRERAGLWNSLAFWRGLSLVTSSLAAAGIGAVLFLRPAPPPPMVAVLNTTDGRSGFMVSVDRGSGRVMLMPAVPGEAPPEHVHELWMIGADGRARSLGTFASSGPVAMSIPQGMMRDADESSAIAISVEPSGGSPTGAPTGPVVAQGNLRSI